MKIQGSKIFWKILFLLWDCRLGYDPDTNPNILQNRKVHSGKGFHLKYSIPPQIKCPQK